MDSENRIDNYVGIWDVFTIIFVTLKLVGVIDWSWLKVLAPTWISLIIYVVTLVLYGLFHYVDKRRKK